MTLVASNRPPKPDFQQQDIGRMSAKSLSAAAVVASKKVIGRAVIGFLDRFERVGKKRVRNQRAAAGRGQPDALAKGDQMRRGVDMDAQPGGLAEWPA